MHIEKINSFAEAEVKWNDTKPIRGKEVDMRPLGKRHRKYERIAKIDDNCYALLDGGTGCNSTWSGHYNEVTWAEVRMLAPILWERHADGTETVRVRNESSTHGHAQQRYSFLQRAMPRGLGWVNRNGKHFIRIRNWRADNGHYLPFSSTRPVGRQGSAPYGYTIDDDHHYVKFRRDEAGVFHFISNDHELPKPPRIRVLKEEKAKFKPIADAFLKWLCAVGPMIEVPKGYKQWQERNLWKNKLKEQVDAWAKVEFEDKRDARKMYSCGLMVSGLSNTEPTFVKDIMQDEAHPLRVVLLNLMLDELDITAVTDRESIQKFKANYNRMINKVCGFQTIVTEYNEGE
jgi:hypothetical protein